MAGDKEAVLSFFSPDATYEMVGAKAFADRVAVGPAAIGPAANRLIDDFQFHDRQQLVAVANGQKAAMVNRLEVSFRGAARVTTDVCDFWEFDASGKVTSLKQFVDTDLVRRMMDAKA
jgi:ketosteroid isomerase-like protein